MNVILIVCTIGAYVSPNVDPETNYFFALFGLIYPWLLLFNFIFILFWLVIRKRMAWLSVITILIGWWHVRSFMGFSINDTSSAHQLRIVSYNTQHAKYALETKGTEREQRKSRWVDFLSRHFRPDIFCGQEMSLYSQHLVEEAFEFRFQHKIKNKGVVIYSRYKIIANGQIDFHTKTNSCLWADIDLGDDTIRVYSAHLQSNRVTSDAERMIEEADLQDRRTWLGMKTMLKKYRKYALIRSEQVDQIQRHMSMSPHPVILCGDINDPPQSYVYKQLTKGMQDSFLKKGRGLGTTFAGKIPALRIDYILADPSFVIHRHRVVRRQKFSDHYPIESIVSLDAS